MSTRVLESDDWSLLLPAEWSAEQDEDTIVIGDSDGVGVIEISELRRQSGDVETLDLEPLMDQSLSWQAITLGSFIGWQTHFLEDATFLREWVLYAGSIILYVTYSCESSHQGLDDAAVDEILATLCYVPP
ncbi:MAG: hypothetical protein AAF671_10010 [Pseudomonadota bacterium]